MAKVFQQQFDLLTNSHSFLNEALSNAVAAEMAPTKWPFAVMHLVQALELSLKEFLRQIHPQFIYTDVDTNTGNTISLSRAIQRVQNPQIGNVEFTQKDNQEMLAAIDWRNNITHQEYSLNSERARANFCDLFNVVIRFQEVHLCQSAETYVSKTLLDRFSGISENVEKLRRKAIDQINSQGIDPNSVHLCEECLSKTYVVVHEDEHKCWTCHTVAQFGAFCSHCQEWSFYSDGLTAYYPQVLLDHRNLDDSPLCMDCFCELSRKLDRDLQADDPFLQPDR